ncbi:putative MutT/nudix family protein [Nocardioidaceae bacterium Broad-1]|uniref:NUDIX domain-containing protein n=1 Tax=Nocardioides luteus TaxID=1844 RepID=UPI0002028EA2|nr:NUDIX hydrolase [Nocardioides luteus]EGD40331.1 putative MutT/nudix family protein [Nocardioidaceae bacterium Broad-1]MBG6095330.1 8-oxo-dGTP pyrophosphatase MutT (NUDIX family) [Nocardioides luteus]
MHFTEYDTRVAAYAVIIDAGRILLSWFNGNHRTEPGWTLPGGGVDYGEQMPAAVRREVKEETGYDVEVGAPLTTNVYVVPFEPGRRPYQSTRVIFEARIVGGELGTLEVDGTTDFAEWVPLEKAAQVPESAADIVRLGIEAWRAQSTQ